MSTHLYDAMMAAATAALAPVGVRAVIDPAASVGPCLQIDITPDPGRLTACGEEHDWTAILRPPAGMSEYLAGRWLVDTRPLVRAALDTFAVVLEQEGIDLPAVPDARPTPAYRFTIRTLFNLEEEAAP